MISLKKDEVSSLKRVKAVVLGPESSETEIKVLLKVNAKSLCLQGRFAVKWVLNTDRGFKATSWTLQNKKGNVQYYFEV